MRGSHRRGAHAFPGQRTAKQQHLVTRCRHATFKAHGKPARSLAVMLRHMRVRKGERFAPTLASLFKNDLRQRAETQKTQLRCNLLLAPHGAPCAAVQQDQSCAKKQAVRRARQRRTFAVEYIIRRGRQAWGAQHMELNVAQHVACGLRVTIHSGVQDIQRAFGIRARRGQREQVGILHCARRKRSCNRIRAERLLDAVR